MWQGNLKNEKEIGQLYFNHLFLVIKKYLFSDIIVLSFVVGTDF